MNKKLNDEHTWEIVGFIKVSPSRYKTIKTLNEDYKMPSEIAKETNLRPTQVSNALNDLKRKELVICLNENAKKGRLYKATKLGLKILEILK
ncbi:MarR family transcriptional regulator [uncultured Methanobrevibacter sp.]|uniref:MarR family transcriptional regulator n=1 Tax=uncultured Methanobrevibacter sp. TaxID=253161 RepID=UPI00261AA71A|nr:MarR family transcriptional regulator [uncultured Methanobrevibacter sp.]